MGFFKAYDMRGTFGKDFDAETVRNAGFALAKTLGAGRWLVGRDCRESGDAVRSALLEGLAAAGAKVCDMGFCTTPMVYFFTAEDGYDASVMITASHNPPGDNGLKVSRRTSLPVGYADGLDKVEAEISSPSFRFPEDHPQGTVEILDRDRLLERYVSWMEKNGPAAPRNLKYAVDCSNGMASILAERLFPGAETINGSMDGRFPAHSPNPLAAEARAQLSEKVRKEGLDFGLIFDGDADRAMFGDENGDFVQCDFLIPVVARETASAGDKVIHDVRTSRGAQRELLRMGMTPVMVPVGHAFAKPILRKTGAKCGGELAGHYYFSEFHGCDSGVLAALRILSAFSKEKASGKTFSGMMKPIVEGCFNSGEINFRVEDKDGAILRILDAVSRRFPPETSRSEMDGIRIEFAGGWINVRKSNTEPYLRLIAECDDPGRLSDWTGILSAAIG